MPASSRFYDGPRTGLLQVFMLVVYYKFGGLLHVWWSITSLVVYYKFGGLLQVWWSIISLVVYSKFGGLL